MSKAIYKPKFEQLRNAGLAALVGSVAMFGAASPKAEAAPAKGKAVAGAEATKLPAIWRERRREAIENLAHKQPNYFSARNIILVNKKPNQSAEVAGFVTEIEKPVILFKVNDAAHRHNVVKSLKDGSAAMGVIDYDNPFPNLKVVQYQPGMTITPPVAEGVKTRSVNPVIFPDLEGQPGGLDYSNPLDPVTPMKGGSLRGPDNTPFNVGHESHYTLYFSG